MKKCSVLFTFTSCLMGECAHAHTCCHQPRLHDSGKMSCNIISKSLRVLSAQPNKLFSSLRFTQADLVTAALNQHRTKPSCSRFCRCNVTTQAEAQTHMQTHSCPSRSRCDNPTDMHTVWRMQRKVLFLAPVASGKNEGETFALCARSAAPRVLFNA